MIRRLLRWWWNELRKPFASDLHEPMDWGDSSEPVEPFEPKPKTIDLSKLPMYGQPKKAESPDFTEVKRDPTPGVYNPDGLTARDLLSDDEKALFEQISPEAPEKVVAYPPKADDQDARDWVTSELERRTGGLTRHPLDMTQYPEPPTEADVAAQAMFRPGARAYFSHGYSMRYLTELLNRAKRKDRTLSTEDLMALRSRGLI